MSNIHDSFDSIVDGAISLTD
uniref:Uncharacterized protein n=1 Tax=Arundo donax TaxID=35708 RepID=A0A0A9DUL0_ARUDO